MPGYLIAIIVIAVIVGIFAIIFSLSARVFISYDDDISARIKFLFIDKAFDLDDVLRKLLKIQDNVESKVENIDNAQPKVENEKTVSVANSSVQPDDIANEDIKNTDVAADTTNSTQNAQGTSSSYSEPVKGNSVAIQQQPQEPKKPNFLKQIYDKDGVLGILLLISSLLQSVNSAIITLIKGLHIRSLYVRMIIGGDDAAKIAMDYGKICGTYYALKGLIFSTMKVHDYDECIEPDYLAKYSDYAFNLELSISIGAVVKVGLVTAKTFIVNLIKNK